MKIQKKQKTWIEESIEKMGECPSPELDPKCFGGEDPEDVEKEREESLKEMNKRLEPAIKEAEKVKEEDHEEKGKSLEESVEETITSYDVKDRKELASLLEELHLTTKDVSIKRSVKEGYRYNVTLKSVLNETKEVTEEKTEVVEEVQAQEEQSLTEGRYSDLQRKLASKKNELAELKVKLEHAPSEEVKEELEVSIDICRNDIANIEGELAEIRYLDNGSASLDYEESLKEDSREPIDREALEFYVKNWHEGDNITVTSDLLDILEQSLEMVNKHGEEEKFDVEDFEKNFIGKGFIFKGLDDYSDSEDLENFEGEFGTITGLEIDMTDAKESIEDNFESCYWNIEFDDDKKFIGVPGIALDLDEMIEESLNEDVNQILIGKPVKFKDEDVTIEAVEDEEGSVIFRLSNGKMIDPRIAFGKSLTSDDEEVIAFIDAHKEKEEEKPEESKPSISEYERGSEGARADFYAKERNRFKKYKKELNPTEFERGYLDAYKELDKSAIAKRRRGLGDITINSTYKGDVEELIKWLKEGGISSIHVTSNEDDYDKTQEFIDELNKRDGTSYGLKTTNKQGDSYEITLTTNKEILDKMPEEVKTWVAPKNSGKFGSTAEKVDALVYSERDHTLTSNGIVKDLLLNYDFHLGDYKEKKESLEESISSDKKKLKYLLDKEECCPLDKQERYELQDLLNKYGYPEDLEESKKGFVTFLNLELGVLYDESDEFEYYSSAYDHKHAYYDETYLNGLENDFEHLKEVALNYIKEGVKNTYAVLTSIDVQGSRDDDYIEYAIQQIEEDGFIDESVDFLDGEQFDVDNVIWSAYKDEEGNIHENFVGKEEVVKEEVLDEMAKLPYGVLAWKLNDIISSMNHEGAYYDSGWLYLWPDGESQEDCMVDFNDKEAYDELKELFEKVYKRYHKDGLYTNDQSIVDYAHKIDAKLGLEPIQNLGKISDKHIGDDPYDESLKESKEQVNEVLDDEEIDDDFFTNDDMIDIEDVDDDMKVGEMSFDDKMDFLAKDEQEAIDGYDEVIDTVEDEHVKDQLEHIRDEEVAHKEFLDAVKEDSSLTYEEHDEEHVDNTLAPEFVDPEDADDDMKVGDLNEDININVTPQEVTVSDEKGEFIAEIPTSVEPEEEDDDFGVYESLSDKDLVDGLVANGSCEDEKEAQERVARMSKEDKESLSKSIKKQAMANLIGD